MFFNFREPRIVRKEKSRGTRTKTYKGLSQISKVAGNAVRVDLVKGVTTFKKKINSTHLANAIETKSVPDIYRTINFDDLDDHLQPAMKQIGKTWEMGVAHQLLDLPPPMKDLRYDMKNPRLADHIEKHTGELIEGVNDDIKATVARAVEKSFNNAMTPDRVAKEIIGSIGLDERREKALANYANKLSAGDFSQDKIDNLVADYGQRLLESRAMTIARTETRNAINQGQLEVWNEGKRQGLIDSTAKKVWIVDGNPCPICEPMDGDAIPLDDPWILDDGSAVMIPSDSHPNCFCGMELDFGQGDGDGEEKETDEDED